MSKLTKEEQAKLKELQARASEPEPLSHGDVLHAQYAAHPSAFSVDLAQRLEALEAAAKKSSKVK